MPHTLLPDVAAGHLMAAGEVDVILVGADRVAANGDTANKVGTYPLAVLAARHGIPFYVCAPTSSVDLATPDGAAIPIEERKADEVLLVRGVRIAPAGTEVRNPSFDVTPAELITGIVTEEGIVRPPFEAGLRAAARRRHRALGRDPGPRPTRPRRGRPGDGPPRRCGRRDGDRRRSAVRDDVVARTTTDRELLRAFLERDRLFAAYAICDLEAREFARTRWAVASAGDEVVSLVLEYNGPTPQPLFVMGRPDGIEAILRDLIRPRAAYVAMRPGRHARGRGALPRGPRSADGPDVGRPGALPPVPGDGRAPAAGRHRRPEPALPARVRLVAAHRPRSTTASTTGSGSTGPSSPRPGRTSSARRRGSPSSATS